MYRIGVDLGGTNIAVGLVDENYKIVRKGSVPTNAKTRSGEEIVDDIAALCKRLCEEEGIAIADIKAIGVASPGVVDFKRGVVEYSCNLPFRRFPIGRLLSERTGVASVHVENDANTAAFGEAIAGAARGTRNSVMITLGTGVGGGIIIDGKVYAGFNFAGAELGHIVIERDGAPCNCGRRGCWESYSSATALIRMTCEKIDECRATGRSTLMSDMVAESGKVSGRTSFDAMRAGDAAATEVVDQYIQYLAIGLTNIVNIFQPEVITIGGGISGERENLLRPLLPLVEEKRYGAGFIQGPRIAIAELGNDAGIIGAAFLGIDL